MKLENHNIYFIGDGAGKAGNIAIIVDTWRATLSMTVCTILESMED